MMPSLRQEFFVLTPQGAETGARPLHIHPGVLTVGRVGAAALEIDDASVSRLHARLDLERGVLTVVNLKSSNGTRVNGQPIVRSILKPGDIVQFGGVSFRVDCATRIAWGRLAKATGALLVTASVLCGLVWGGRLWSEKISQSREQDRVRRQAAVNVTQGIAAYRAGDVPMAQSYFSSAADLLILADLVPDGTSASRGDSLFGPILGDLAPEAKTFRFADAAVTPRAEIDYEANLPDREYVELKCRHIAVALLLDKEVPRGFVDQVWNEIEATSRHPGKFQATLNRSKSLEGPIRTILREEGLPDVVFYIAWVESDLKPDAESYKHAKGLWQLMPHKAKEYNLRVDSEVDERTDVIRSTHAAAKLIGDLISMFGNEQFTCALAGYNRGEYGVFRAMKRIKDRRMASSKKFWYMAENGLLPEETRDYVPRIFAYKILAEAPERFSLHHP